MSEGPLPLSASLDGPAGAPVLVLGNSLGTSSGVWDRQVQALGDRYRLLRYELPGHGASPAAGRPYPAADGPYTIARLGAGVLALLDAHGIDQADYCGISLGGMIGMWLAANAPGRITALGLVCTSAYLPPADGWQARAALVRAQGMAPVVEPSTGRWFTPAFIEREPEVAGAFAAELERADPDGYADCCLAIAAMDLRADLAAITAPTLVISGGSDPATPPAHGAAIAAGISGARHLVIDGASHLATVSCPAEVTGALLDHLGSIA
jgi:3-oxoadipate enol-lactonase